MVPLLVNANRIWEHAAFNARSDRLFGLVDGVRAEAGDETIEDCLVFLGSPFVHRPGRNLGKVGTRNKLRKPAIAVEYESALGIWTPTVGLAPSG
jgi:hypothetical protein